MIEYITVDLRLTPEQAYVVASVAVDLRIGQLVDAPNVASRRYCCWTSSPGVDVPPTTQNL